jgi:hypothetical protein
VRFRGWGPGSRNTDGHSAIVVLRGRARFRFRSDDPEPLVAERIQDGAGKVLAILRTHYDRLALHARLALMGLARVLNGVHKKVEDQFFIARAFPTYTNS